MMGKIKSSSIELLKNSAAVYRPGESVSGTVTLNVEGEIKINKVDLMLLGKGLTKWSPFLKRPLDDDYSSEETYVNVYTRFVKQPVDVLTAGIHKYSFNFRIPSQGLPSSFEGRYGAVRYWLKLLVDKKFPALDHVNYTYLIVLANIDVNDPTFKGRQWYKTTKTMAKTLGFGDAGTVTLRASLDRKAYCPGEEIKVSLEAKNESTKNCGTVKAFLRQTVNYSAGSDTNSVKTAMPVTKGSTLEAGKEIKWDNQPITVLAIPPSTVELTCHIIKVLYHVVVEVEVNMGFNLAIAIPVTIGTIPLGVSISKEPNLTASRTYEFGLSKFVFYRPCKIGVERFHQTKDDFMDVLVIPRTAFAQNITTAPKQLASAASAAKKISTATSNKKLVDRGASAVITKASQSVRTATVASNTLPSEKSAVVSPALDGKQASRPLPSAPSDQPPTYDEVVTQEIADQCQGAAQIAVPNYLAESSGVGSVLLLIFPTQSCEAVQGCFRRSMVNMLSNCGQILAFSKQISVIPSSPETGGVLLYFPTQRASLSWLQSQRVTFPDLATNWWALVGENSNFEYQDTPDIGFFKEVLVILTKFPLIQTSTLTAEKARLCSAFDLLPKPEGKVNKVFSSSKFLFASGEWDGFPCRESDPYCFQVVQFQTSENCETYKKTAGDFMKLCNCKQLILHTLSTTELYLFSN